MKKIFIIGIFLFAFLLISGCKNNNVAGSAIAEDYVKIPLSDLSSEVEFYTFEDSGVEINYFAVLGSDGEVRTAFDACDVCGGNKGYEQKRDDIRCRNCGRVFRIDGLGTKNEGYGCWPSYLPHEIKGDNVLIKIDDMKGGRKRFV